MYKQCSTLSLFVFHSSRLNFEWLSRALTSRDTVPRHYPPPSPALYGEQLGTRSHGYARKLGARVASDTLCGRDVVLAQP